MQIRRYGGWLIVVIAVAVALTVGLLPQPVWVEISQAKKETLTVDIVEEGKTRVIDRYVISAPVAGYARRIELDVGDAVKQGQVLTELEPLRSAVLDPRSRAEAQARVAASGSALSAAEEKAAAAGADADYANAEYKRKQRLAKTNFVSEEELLQASTEVRRTRAYLRSAKFAVEVGRYELDAAKTLLQYSAAKKDQQTHERVSIASPVLGSVLNVARESEGVVSAGTPLLEVGNSRALEVAIDVLSIDAVRIKAGTQVLFERWGGDVLQGTVRLVEPVGFTKVSALGVEEQRVWVIADITSPAEQWQRLGDGYRIEARFILWQQDNVLVIPSSSLFRVDDQWAVFVVDDDRARRQFIEVGRHNGLQTQITKGVNPGDRIVKHPDDNLVDGQSVRLHGE